MAAPNPCYLMIDGQSNALGGDRVRAKWAPRSNLKFWNNAYDGSTAGTAYITPVSGTNPFPTSESKDNPGYRLAEYIANETGVDVKAVLSGQGAQGIQEWVSTDTDPARPQYDEAVAAWSASGNPPASVWLWWQGESNRTGNPTYSCTKSEYKTLWKELRDSYAAAGVIDANTIILLVELKISDANLINDALEELANEEANTFFVPISGLKDIGDDTHINSEGIQAVGKRSWEIVKSEFGITHVNLNNVYVVARANMDPNVPTSGTNITYRLGDLLKTLLALALSFSFLLGCNVEAKPETFIAGDSLCTGVAQASGLKSVARVGAPAREVISQLQRIPEGATVIVCAGTNDAANRLNGFQAAVDAVLLAAEKRKQRIIWLGPISTSLWWNQYSDQADTILALKVKSYISLRAVKWNWDERAGDRIHLTARGYARLWAIAKEKL